jgi:DNA-directed RNA polymerase III subunit RPC1
LPIFHIGFFKYTINILQCICKGCARVLLKKEDKENFKKSLSNKRLKSSKARERVFKSIIDACKKIKQCGHCGEINGVVKHVQAMEATLIIHDRYNQKVNADASGEIRKKFEAAGVFFKELDINSLNNKLFEELTAPKVHSLFTRIPRDDVVLFDMNPDFSNPVDLLLNYIIVPPLSIRPSVQVSHNLTNEDDLTCKIYEILGLNKAIKISIAEGGNTTGLLENITNLQHTHAQYINSDTKGLNKNVIGTKQIRDLTRRLEGKNGRFRGNLSGKRTDFSGRTVISPDPNLKIDQVGVPVLIAKTMTFPQRVFSKNLEQMKKLVLNGPDNHPGANFVELLNGNKIFLQYTSRKKVAEELKIGDVVERHLMDDDIILFNRQPSLHRLSIMAFRAKVLPWRTLRFNECVCTPFNADFDGDEMNLHLPQTEEAKSEALYLMGVKENLITPKSAEPLIAATQDFLTSSYIITQRDYFMDRAHFFQYLTYFNDANEKIDIPPPCILKPKELWSGKQLYTLLLRPNRRARVIVNVEVKARNYSKKYKTDEFRCPNDGYVVIKNSELLLGNICKTSIGSGSKVKIYF